MLERNYKTPLENKKAVEEEKLLKPKYLESVTHFIPKISANSKKLVTDRNEGDIHK